MYLRENEVLAGEILAAIRREEDYKAATQRVMEIIKSHEDDIAERVDKVEKAIVKIGDVADMMKPMFEPAVAEPGSHFSLWKWINDRIDHWKNELTYPVGLATLEGTVKRFVDDLECLRISLYGFKPGEFIKINKETLRNNSFPHNFRPDVKAKIVEERKNLLYEYIELLYANMNIKDNKCPCSACTKRRNRINEIENLLCGQFVPTGTKGER
jgi:hypothetical protein